MDQSITTPSKDRVFPLFHHQNQFYYVINFNADFDAGGVA
jgi:hypothetical protein